MRPDEIRLENAIVLQGATRVAPCDEIAWENDEIVLDAVAHEGPRR